MSNNLCNLLALVFFSSISLAGDFCSDGVFFKADNGEQAVELCLKEETRGIYYSSGKLVARVFLKKEMKVYELSMPDLFSIQYGEVFSPVFRKWSFDSELGSLPLIIKTKFLDLRQVNDPDLRVSELRATLRLKIGEWLWQKDFSAICQEIDAIKGDDPHLMAGKFISEAVSQAILKTIPIPRPEPSMY